MSSAPVSAEERARTLAFDPDKPLARGDTNENPPGLSFAALLREDFRTHGNDPRAAGFWALAVHRFGNLRMDIKSRALRAPATLLYRAAYHAVIAMWGIDLPYNVKIGRRLRIVHHGCLHLGAQVVGDDVVIRHSATIGLLRRTEQTRAPLIGNRVEIGPGACIVGGITVGDDCYVGPNTLLGDSIPEGTTVIGVPARVVKLEQLVEREKPGEKPG